MELAPPAQTWRRGPYRFETGRQGVTTVKDAQRIVYPHGALQQALQPGEMPAQIVFRSRLEADWANTLDRLSIKWVYEPRLFTLANGRQYLPDFHLPELGSWLEVKGPGVPGLDKTVEFARDQDGLVIAGLSPALVPGHGFRMRFRGVVERAGLALCHSCHRYQWATIAFQCRLCGGTLADINFYRCDTAPFYPAPWAGE